jgi:peptidoglycan/LPS O-acetylase OafA/YrhL
VVIFFVLSGYVICHAARPELGLAGYAQHRIARILPVALVAILFSLCIAPFVDNHVVRNSGPAELSWESIVFNLFFLGQSWTDVQLWFNAPYWSLNYEVWYYVIFALWFYRRSYALVILAALVAGPRILLLFPVWLLGVGLHRWMGKISPRYAPWLFGLTLIAGLAFFGLDAGVRIREAMRGVWPDGVRLLKGSNQFVGDFMLGLIVSLNFLAAGSMNLNVLRKLEKPIRFLASVTFSAYIFHLPLTVLLWTGLQVHDPFGFYGLLAGGILAFGWITERRTKAYRHLLNRFFPIKEEPQRRPDANPVKGDAYQVRSL